MRKKSRASQFATRTVAVMAAAAGALAFTASASAGTFNATDTASFATAVTSANAAPGSTINLAPGTYSPTATVELKAAVTIQGPAQVANVTSTVAQFDGSSVQPPNSPVFKIDAGVTASFANIAVTNGGGNGNPAIDDLGTANFTASSIVGNTGAGLFVEPGATTSIVNSTFSDGLDLGIVDQGTATLSNTTVTRNTNGGVDNGSGTLKLINTIVAKNGTSKNCTIAVLAANADHSLDSDSSCGVGAQSGKDPLLGAINVSGGGTPTDLPAAGSPALDNGNPATCATVDQRGAARPDDTGTACDIGSVERYTLTPAFTTSNVKVASATASKAVSYTPTWTDAGAPVKSTCNPASGSTFTASTGAGTATTVNCTGTDSFGNAGSGSFTVTVVQDTPPTITTTPAGNQTVAAVDATGATYSYTATANDAFDGPVAATCVPASGSKFKLGATTVNCSASNSVGQTGTSSFVVTVADQTPPVIAQPSDVTVVGPDNTVVNYPTPTATDNVDTSVTVTCLPASGTQFHTGATLVTCNAKDAAGNNAAPKTFTVNLSSVGQPQTNQTVQGEVPNGGSPGGLQITAATCEFGAVFIPALTSDYVCTAAATVTSSDTTTTLTENDISSAATTGHLVQGSYSLASQLKGKASSAKGTGGAYTGVPGPAPATPITVLTYSAPVNQDAVTLNYQQHIDKAEVLHNGTYGATVLLQLSGQA